MLLVLALGSKEPLVTLVAAVAMAVRLVFEEVLEALVEAAVMLVKEAWVLVVDTAKEAFLLEAEVVV